MATNNGGWITYPDQTPKATFARAGDRASKIVTVKSGQVIKALSFVESDVNGKVIAHGGLVESALVTFASGITTGQTVILAGLTFTAGSSSVTAAQLADIWSGLVSGTTSAQANAIILAKGYPVATIGVFSGTLAGYGTTSASPTKVRFDATGTGAASATDVAITGTGAGAGSVAIVQYAAFNKIAGVLAFDVDATSGDVEASVYTEASFWADALVWAVDVTVDTITTSAGTTACTAYNTGCSGTSAESNLLKKKFVENTDFEPLTFKRLGETY
jgi:hypothetical protein